MLDGIGIVGQQSEKVIVWKGVDSAAANVEEHINGPTCALDGVGGMTSQVQELKRELTELYEEDSMLDAWIGALENFSNTGSQTGLSGGLYCEKDEVLKALPKKRHGEVCDGLFEDKICFPGKKRHTVV